MHCHVQAAVTKFSKNLNFTEDFKIVPFKVHARCLSPCPQLVGLPSEHPLSQDKCSVTGTIQMTPSDPRCLQQHDQSGVCQGKWLHLVLFFQFGNELICTVLFPLCREVLWNDVIWGNSRPGRFVYVCLPSQPYPCLLIFTATIPNLNCTYLTNTIFHSDIFHLTRGVTELKFFKVTKS